MQGRVCDDHGEEVEVCCNVLLGYDANERRFSTEGGEFFEGCAVV
jgi:hypothetical protein